MRDGGTDWVSTTLRAARLHRGNLTRWPGNCLGGVRRSYLAIFGHRIGNALFHKIDSYKVSSRLRISGESVMVEASAFLTICSGRLEPTMTEVTAGLDRAHASTSCVGS